LDIDCLANKGWSKIGQTIFRTITGKFKKRSNIIAALCEKKMLAPLAYTQNTTTDFMINWVENHLVPCLKVGQVVILDNASFHKSPKIKELIEGAGCTLKYLPPYSPNLNPIETFWANMKKWIKKNISQIQSTLEALQTFINRKT